MCLPLRVVYILYYFPYLTNFSLLNSFYDINPFFHVFPIRCSQDNFSLWCDHLNEKVILLADSHSTNFPPNRACKFSKDQNRSTKHNWSHFLNTKQKFQSHLRLLRYLPKIMIILINNTSITFTMFQALFYCNTCILFISIFIATPWYSRPAPATSLGKPRQRELNDFPRATWQVKKLS